MKLKLIAATVFVSLVLAYVGFTYYGRIVMMLVPDGVALEAPFMTGMFSISLLFALACALFPLGLLVLWRVTKTNNAKERALSAGIVLLFTLALFVFRYHTLNILVAELNAASRALTGSHDIEHGIPINIQDIRLHLYLFIGQFAGSVVAFFFLKKRAKYRTDQSYQSAHS